MEVGHLLLILLGLSLMVLAGAIRRRSARRLEERTAQHRARTEGTGSAGSADA